LLVVKLAEKLIVLAPLILALIEDDGVVEASFLHEKIPAHTSIRKKYLKAFI